MPSICWCCGGLAYSKQPDFNDAAQHLTAQANDCHAEGGLARVSQATLVYGTVKFKVPGVHGWSPAAQISLDTHEATQLVVRLDGSGVYLASTTAAMRYCTLSDLLADSSPGYVAAYTNVYGSPPQVQRRKAAAATTALGNARRDMRALMVSEQFTRLSVARQRDRQSSIEAVRLRVGSKDDLASMASENGRTPQVLVERVPPQRVNFSVAQHLSGLTHSTRDSRSESQSSGRDPSEPLTPQRESSYDRSELKPRSDLRSHEHGGRALFNHDHDGANGVTEMSLVIAPLGSPQDQQLDLAQHMATAEVQQALRPEGLAEEARMQEQTGDASNAANGATSTALPAAAHAFVGAWKHRHSENYGAFLSENVGLGRVLAKIGERIHPTPTFRIIDGELISDSVCLGAKPVREELRAGENFLWHEPNVGVDYAVRGWWEGDVYVAERVSERINGGRPCVQRRWIDKATGELVMSQDWGGKKPFVAHFTRAKSS